MKRMTLFRILVVLVLCVGGLGFYRGWFTLSSHRAGDGGTTNDVNLTLKPDKVKDDARALKDKAADLTGTAANETPQDSESDGLTPKG